MCQQQVDKLRKQCDHTVKLFLELEQKFIEKEKKQHECSLEYNEILQNQRLTATPSEKGAEETHAEPVNVDVDDDLILVDECTVVGEKGGPLIALPLCSGRGREGQSIRWKDLSLWIWRGGCSQVRTL